MNAELDKKLCEKYPKIFVNRTKSMQESCMYWGFECGDGWYGIIDALCEALTYTYTTGVHLDKKTAKRLGVEPYTYKNYEPRWHWPSDRRPRPIIDGKVVELKGHRPALKEWFTYPPKYAWQKLKYLLRPTHTVYSFSPEAPQVVADQVKEKFGTLRFYYHLEYDPRLRELAYGKKVNARAREVAEHYSNYIDGIVHMAEILSARTCEETGKEGEMHVTGNRYGWYRTLNREYAKTDERCVSRNFVPVADLPKEPEETT